MTWALWASVSVAWSSGWLEKSGELRVGLGANVTHGDQQFAPGDALGLVGDRCEEPVYSGDRSPYDCEVGGRLTMFTLSAQGALGVHEHLTLDVTVPVVPWARFVDDGQSASSSAIGDVRIGLRAGGKVGPWSLVGALHLGMPSGPRPIAHDAIPIGEKHWNLEPGLRVGVSLGAWGWLESWQTTRWRFPVPDLALRFGPEWTGLFSMGVKPTKWLAITTAVDWIVAGEDEDVFGLTTPGRQMVAVRPGIGFLDRDRWWVGADVGVPLAGRRWPASPVVNFVVVGRFGLW